MELALLFRKRIEKRIFKKYFFTRTFSFVLQRKSNAVNNFYLGLSVYHYFIYSCVYCVPTNSTAIFFIKN